MSAISNIISSIARSDADLDGLPLTIRVDPRARRLRLKVDRRARALLLTVPPRVSRRRALAWAAEHREWAERALTALPANVPFAPGATIPVEGIPHRIDWSSARPRRIEVADGRLLAGGPIEGLDRRVRRWLKEAAIATLDAETREYAAKAGVMPSRVSIGDPVSRWGSCAASGAIRYSWRLILAPEFVRRATVAHEVAHLVHMNHGPAFHALVADLFGADPRPARAWLRREGAGLHFVGAT
ncbi:MAG: M48 family metallopeptidase [Sphingomonas sp.]|nr:M48 family metallopeptidase [Sphingomonas sp.]